MGCSSAGVTKCPQSEGGTCFHGLPRTGWAKKHSYQERRRKASDPFFFPKIDEYRIYQWSGWVTADPDNLDLPDKNYVSLFDERLC
jgi:hypothetical protein